MSVEPIISQGTTLPPQIASADQATQQAYAAAVSFEQVLMNQLTDAMSQTTSSDSSDDSSDGSSDDATTDTDPYAQLLPQALGQSLSADNGLGLTSALMASFGHPMPTTAATTTTTKPASTTDTGGTPS